MIGRGAESESVVSLNDVKKILEERKKRRELAYEQTLAEDHAIKTAKLDRATEKKVRTALLALGLSEKAAIKIVDIMPKSAMTIRQILSRESGTFGDEEVAKIIAVVKENA